MLSKSLKATLLAFAWANIHWIALTVLAFGLTIYLISSVQSCNREREQKKIDERKAEVNQEKGKISILTEEKNEQSNTVKQAENNSNVAADNAARVANTDSGERSGDAERAIREYCKDHPGDSNCKDY